MDDSFGCCSSYIECSEKGACIHLDDPEYSNCTYRRHLEAGRVFYGNKKIEKIGRVKIMLNLTIQVDSPEEMLTILKKLALDKGAGGNKPVSDPAPTVAKAEVEVKPEVKAEQETKPETKVDPDPKEDPVKDPDPEPTVTLEQVRAKLAELSQAGKQARVKALITGFGVARLSDIPADKYGELLKAAEAEATK